jgi:hypothetical protein
MSKIKVNEIEAATGSTVTIPTGQTFSVVDGIPATNLSGTIADARLPTVPVSKGGTGVTSLGTANQVLAVNSGANALEFQDASSGGIAQFKHTNQASGQTHSSSSYTTLTGVTATLTPASTSSKVYVMAGVNGRMDNANSGWRVKIQRVIGGSATDVWEEADQKATYHNGSSSQLYVRTPYAYLDTPNTTSAVTYQLQVYTDGNSTVLFNTAGPSYITIMEVTV